MTILFSDVVLLLDRIAKTRSKTPLQHLEEWLSLLTGASHHQGLLLFRLIFPEHDVRRRYGLKETLLARELQKALGFASKSLELWNDSSNDIVEDMDAQKRRAGCFGNTLEAILVVRRDATLEYPSLALERLDALLDELASHCDYSCRQLRAAHFLGPNKRHRSRNDVLYDLFSAFSAREACFLSQIILRDLSPLLYPLPTVNQERALLDYNSNYYKPLEIYDALKAWSWALPSIWRFRSDLDAAFGVLATNKVLDRPSYTDAEAEKLLRRIALPAVGTRIEIPKAAKGRSLRSVAEVAEQAAKVWLETKYDGERMQIHIGLDATDGNYLKIFSKSKRDSTQDRILTHPIILSALNLSHSLSPTSPPSPHLLRRTAEAPRSQSREPIRSIILEAEMVPYNEAEEKIDEFGTLPDCTGPSAHENGKPDLLESSQTSASSILSAITPQRHLAIVFFDILSLNGLNLLFDSYDHRRKALESVIRPIEGYSMLAERTSIDFKILGSTAGYEALVRAFARAIVDRQEGLMLKPASSTYNDRRRGQQWIKLKRDYIPGLGDTASFLIVGASWSKERGRELNVPNTLFTTFFIGLLENGWEVENGMEAKPRYHVLFSVEHFPSRGDLLNANRKVAERGGVDTQTWSSRVGNSWLFNLSFSPALVSRPTFVFSKPLVFELFGASFVKPRGTPHYVLRFPRVSAIHHTRTEKECVDLRQLQVLAREACSFVESEAEEEVDDLWRRFSGGESGSEAEAPSKDRLTAGWREKQEQEWYDKLIQADKPKAGRTNRKRKNTNSPQVLLRKPAKKVVTTERVVPACEVFTAKMALSDAQEPDKTLVDPNEAPYEMMDSRLLIAPPLAATSPNKPRSTLISSSRSGSFVEFVAPHPVQQDYFWTVFPRTVTLPTACMPMQTRMHCIDRVMEGAGWQRKVDQPSRPTIASSWRAGRIYTGIDQADALAEQLKINWRPSGGDAAQVSICDASSVNSSSEQAVLALLEV